MDDQLLLIAWQLTDEKIYECKLISKGTRVEG